MGWGIHGGVFYEHLAASCQVSRSINGPHRITGPCGENLSFVRSNIVQTEVRRMSVGRRSTSVPGMSVGVSTVIDVEYIYGFVGWGSANEVDDVTA